MLQAHAPFPYPGSTALFDGLRWRIHQLFGDTALITREGTAASLSRRAPVAELVDPVEADQNALMALQDVSAATKRIALFTAGHLRTVNDVALYRLGRDLTEAARLGRIPQYQDNSHLARVMRSLGWRKDGYAGEGYERSPRYIRVATPAKAQ